MDVYHPDTVFSSIDRQGRYAWANQPQIAVWNLAQFATCLIPLMGEEEAAVEAATTAVHRFAPLYQAAWLRRFGDKLGIDGAANQSADREPAADDGRTAGRFHPCLRGPVDGTARDEFADPAAFDAWARDWQALSPDTTVMVRANPRRIPRNTPGRTGDRIRRGGRHGAFRTTVRRDHPSARPAHRLGRSGAGTDTCAGGSPDVSAAPDGVVRACPLRVTRTPPRSPATPVRMD